ncbi:hypothetical protein VSDG_05969 [Cytospora chrysosperma]|uniref:CN hydrolase domain-containing protein n=1 Tax=Cytospora chrysosperma TaxID=252740 RepID=A0A423VTU3_CYTCH|nr:hypothetical protein VSDG_05969 [Valsa sordida]
MSLPRFKIKAAVVHAAPVYMDKEATTAKVVRIIRDAGKQGIKLLAFPETFIPGYPYFIMAYPPLSQTAALARYAEQSVVCEGDDEDPSMRAVREACREAGVAVNLGVSERMAGGGYTLFNSQVTIDHTGALLGVHRKLQPTHAERFVWGQGDGSTLRAWRVDVVGDDGDGEGKGGNPGGHYNLGGLCCWENTHNGARQALIEEGQHVHVGGWPAISALKGFGDGGVGDAQVEALMKSHALTAQVFVMAAAPHVDDGCLRWMEENLGPQDSVAKGGGWSAIIHPFCSFLAGPETGGGDRLVTAELDSKELGPVKVWIDGNGHYKRPEVLEMRVDRTQRWTVPGQSVPGLTGKSG